MYFEPSLIERIQVHVYVMNEIYQYFNEFVSLCTYVDTWCIFFYKI
jgi:hypothetical protein